MANSAYYDGTGRLISSLPDSATVSAIASSYAESAASSKLDTSAQVVTATAGDGTYITSINGMGLSGQGGGGGGAGDYLEKSAQEVEIGNGNSASSIALAQGLNNSATIKSFAQGNGNSAYSESFAQGNTNTAYSDSFAQGIYNRAYNESFVQGVSNSASNHSFAQGNTNSAYLGSFAQGGDNTAYSNAFAQGDENYAYGVSFAQGQRNSAINRSFAQGDYNSAINTAAVFGKYNLHGDGDTSSGDSAAFAIGDGTANGARHDLMLVTKDGEITMFSSTADTVGLGLVSSIKAISANAGGPVTATASAAATAYTSTGTARSSFTAISSINGSALLARNLLPNAQQANGDAHFHFMPTTSPWGSTEYTGLLGPLQYATGAALAMKQQGAYGAYYKGNEWFISDVGTNTAANGVVRAELHRTRGIHLYGSSLNSATGFHLNGSGVDGQSGTSAWQYGPTEYNMLIDVNNTVNTQSANWGGSALALSAGPGVKLEMVGDTLVASTDETVLWEGAGTSSCTLSENCTNFERIKILYGLSGGTGIGDGRWIETYPGVKYLDFTRAKGVSNAHITWVSMSVQPTTITVSATRTMSFGPYTATAWSEPTIVVNNGEDRNAMYKVVGINRTAEA